MGRRRAYRYRCPACHGESRLNRASGIVALVIFVAAMAITLGMLELVGAPLLTIYVVATIEVLAIPLIFARMCRFDG